MMNLKEFFKLVFGKEIAPWQEKVFKQISKNKKPAVAYWRSKGKWIKGAATVKNTSTEEPEFKPLLVIYDDPMPPHSKALYSGTVKTK